MLWYKAWLETRARFLFSLFGIATLPSWYVLHEDRAVKSLLGAEWSYRTLHGGHALLAAMWIPAVILLTMGGLLRERAAGTASFTLSLPVARSRLMRVRILCGLAQAASLAVVPWSLMYLTALATGSKATSISQALFHLTLLAGGGVVFFAAALLISSLVEGEYTAPVIALGLFFVDLIALADEPLRSVSPWSFMLGAEYLSRPSQMLVGALPWTHLAANVVLAALLTAISIRVIERTEF
jgi:ABC-2 type transport system permease protein